MSNTNKTVEGLDFLQSLRLLATAYEEISVIKMQRTKSSVLANREYIAQLSGVFYDVKVNYDAAKKAQEQQAKGFSPFLAKQQFKTGNKNGKTVSVFVSSRERLYGDIIKKIYHLFQFQVFLLGKKQASDIVIIGKYGKQLVDEMPSPPKYQFFDLPDTNISPDKITPLTKILNEYETVNVFYGKLENVMTQNATVAHVSGDQPMDTTKNTTLPQKHYFFEPSLEGVMDFFQTQVFNSLFYQTLHETELARLASRIKAMEEALGNIDKNENLLKQESRRFKHRLQNKKQLDTLTGIKLWKRR